MNNAEIIRGINMTIEGLTLIKSALSAESSAPVAEDIIPAPAEAPVAETSVAPVSIDVETLKKMKYNEFKKYASSLGVKCTGTRDEIMERILALDSAPAEEEDVKSLAEAPAEEASDKPARSKKVAKKTPAEPARDEFDEQAEAIAEDTDVEDIIEALADVDIKATKKNAVSKLAEALRRGLIELDDDDEEEVEDEETEEEEYEDEETEESDEEVEDDEEGVDYSADSYFPEFDPEGINNPEEMSDERREAVESMMDSIIEDFSNDALTQDDIDDFLENFADHDEIDLLGDEPTFDGTMQLYMEMRKRFIDNDGEAHEPSDPYEVGDRDMCCGHELKYIKKTKKYVCEHCGAEYEAE